MPPGFPANLKSPKRFSLPAPLCGHVRSIVSEGLSNIARHAKASAARLRVQNTGCSLEIEISDNGIGFDVGLIGKEDGHYGLIGLRERARLCGGTFNVESSPGNGTSIRLSLPLGVNS